MNTLFLLYLLCLKGSQNFTSIVIDHSLNIEICNNQIDDDNDESCDVFDPDCPCSTSLGPINFVPNGRFEETTKCCADLKVSNCLENWVLTGPSPDYVSDNCPNADLRPDIKALSNSFNTAFNEGYIFGLVNQRENRHFTESMGVCLTEPLLAGKTYRLFFDLGNLRNNNPNMLFSILGIASCNSLSSYNTMGNNGFCELGLPFEELGTVNAQTLSNGWNSLEFDFTPVNTIEALFYSSNCAFEPTGEEATFYMVLDNISIYEVEPMPDVVDINVFGDACAGTLNFVVEAPSSYTYQWYKDSIAINGANEYTMMVSDHVENLTGTYQVLLTNEFGNCRLSTPLKYIPPDLGSHADVILCEGETYRLGEQILSETGVYLAVLTNAFGCDSVAVVDLTVSEHAETFISKTICQGSTYLFSGLNLEDPGIYQDTLLNASACDSIITLNLSVAETVFGDTLFAKQSEGFSYAFHGDTYTESGLYETILPTSIGCDSIVYLSLLIQDDIIPKIYIPNAFSPNSDGQNDYFQAEALPEVLAQIEEMKIFNRWGTLVFQQKNTSSQLAPSWDGTIKGQPAPLGVYIYAISWVNQGGYQETLAGELVLSR